MNAKIHGYSKSSGLPGFEKVHFFHEETTKIRAECHQYQCKPEVRTDDP